MCGQLVLNGTTEIRGSRGDISVAHVSEATALWLQTMVALTAGDTVELQGNFRAADGYLVADHTFFWGAKIGWGRRTMAPQRPEDGFVRMPEHEFEVILARAAEAGGMMAHRLRGYRFKPI